MRKALVFALFLVAAARPTLAADLTPAWPSLAEQTLKAGVQPDSALARLIAANQDFSLLRPEEAGDKIRIPLWLRVHWRKSHPTGVFPAADPTGGYPFVLKEVWEWMLAHQDLQPGAATPDAAPGKTASLGADHRISGAQTAPRSESDIRIDFLNPNRIISASNDISASGRQGVYYSADGGVTWGQTSLALQTALGDAFHSDPTVDWTSDGTAWSTTIGINSAGSILKMRSYKSTDGGATWTFDATFSGATQTDNDKQMIWVDHSSTSAFKDNLYAIWHNGLPVFMNRRTGPAGSWQTPIQVSGAETTGTGIGGDVKTNADGEVFGFWPDTGSQNLFVVKSTTGGVSYGTPVKIATTFDSFDIGVPSFAGRRALIYISGGVYKTATKNLVYASWVDLTGATGCTTGANEPGTNVASTCKTRVWFARSADGGATWSTPVMLNNQASLNDQYNQWLTVDPTNGVVGVIYYDTVADAARKKSNVYYQSSFDDGATWSAALKVSSAPTDETSAGADNGNQYGDYNGLSGYATKFFPTWTDRRTSGPEEIWTAQIDDVPCTFSGIPAIGTATAPANNQVQVSWTNGAPAAAKFNVYRAQGTCAAPGAFSKVGSLVAASPFLDTTVSGTLTYAYKVTGLDATGACESAASACVEVVATGTCTAPPTFAGVATATNAGTATCGVNLSWSAGTPTCAGPLTYKVYRGIAAGFTPGPANLLISGVAGTSFLDTALLNNSTTYYYAVHAVDSSNGAEEANTAQKSAMAAGPVAVGTLTETFEGSALGGFDNPGWSHAALNGTADWAWSTARSQTPTHSWFSADQTAISDRVLVSPQFTVQANTALSFWHTFAFEGTSASCFDGGTLEITTNGGTTWSVVPDGAFTAGVFNGTVSSTGNPINGKRAWCGGTLGALTQVTASLGGFASTTARLRWHEGDDSSVAASGWYVDSVSLTNAGIAASCSPGAGNGLRYFTLTPCRLLDTRNPAGPLGGPALAAGGAQRTFDLAGVCAIPASARALSVNATVVSPGGPGDLRMFAADQATPLATVINFATGQTRTNNLNLPLAWTLNTFKVQNDTPGTVHLILDVNGYYQ